MAWLSFFPYFSVLGTFVAISYASPIFIALVIPIGLAYVIVQKIYVKTARQLKRLESAARSPIYSLFSETLSGLSTIRAYGLQDQFAKENEARLDYSQSCVQPNIVSTRWLSVRLECKSLLLVWNVKIIRSSKIYL